MNIRRRVREIAKQSGVNLKPRHIEAALSYPGTDLDWEFLQTLLKYHTLQTGMTIPLAAESTGLLRKTMTVESDDLITEVNVNKIDFSHSAVEEKEVWAHAETILPRADKCGAIGGLWLAKVILDAQEKRGDEELGKIIPLKEKMFRVEPIAEFIVLPRTIVRWEYYEGRKFVPYLSWGKAGHGQFSLEFLWVGDNMIMPGYHFATPAE